MISFTVKAKDTGTAARVGLIKTAHGEIHTPAFLPVASQGSVKALTPEEVRQVGADIVLANTYHLYLRPGIDLIRKMGGLHHFMKWDGPILTDSGGFQAYSLSNLRRITDAGILFRSHIDGTEHLLTPEAAVLYQKALGVDVIMPLDECIGFTQERNVVEAALRRTHRWAALCLGTQISEDQAMFGIVQGGIFQDLRRDSAEHLASLNFSGYALGGLAVGEPREMMYEVVEYTAGFLPRWKPRYLMGIGSPDELVECVSMGVDLFDCALPTRVARHGGLFTSSGRVNIGSSRFRFESGPVEEGCDCLACVQFSASYIHHLYRSGELLALRLGSIHNLRFVLRLMEELRQSILDGTFLAYRRQFLGSYTPTDQAARSRQKQKWLAKRFSS